MIAEKAERHSAAFMSWAQEMTKFRTTSVVIGSAAVVVTIQDSLRLASQRHVTAGDCFDLPIVGDQRRRGRLFDDGGAADNLARRDAGPVDDGRIVGTAAEVDAAAPFLARLGGSRFGGARPFQAAKRSNAQIGHFDPIVGARMT